MSAGYLLFNTTKNLSSGLGKNAWIALFHLTKNTYSISINNNDNINNNNNDDDNNNNNWTQYKNNKWKLKWQINVKVRITKYFLINSVCKRNNHCYKWCKIYVWSNEANLWKMFYTSIMDIHLMIKIWKSL